MSSHQISDEQPEMPVSESLQDGTVSDSAQTAHDSPITYIDHTRYFDYDPSVSDTPLLETIKKAYCTLCLVRKACEINGFDHQAMSEHRITEIMELFPAKYSDIMPYTNIIFVGLMDFAKSAFGDFTKMSAVTRHSLVYSNFQLLQCLDGAYASLKHFPEETKFMASYRTFVDGDSLDGFFNGCSEELEKEQVVKNFRQNFEVIKSSKLQFRNVKPTIDEFIAIFGLAVWNGYTTNMSVATAKIVTRSRNEILTELQSVYIRNGTKRYTSRMAQVIGLLSNIFRDLQKPSGN